MRPDPAHVPPLVERVRRIRDKAAKAGKLAPERPPEPSTRPLRELPLDYAQRAAGEHRAA